MLPIGWTYDKYKDRMIGYYSIERNVYKFEITIDLWEDFTAIKYLFKDQPQVRVEGMRLCFRAIHDNGFGVLLSENEIISQIHTWPIRPDKVNIIRFILKKIHAKDGLINDKFRFITHFYITSPPIAGARKMTFLTATMDSLPKKIYYLGFSGNKEMYDSQLKIEVEKGVLAELTTPLICPSNYTLYINSKNKRFLADSYAPYDYKQIFI